MASHFLPMGGRFSSTQSGSFVEEKMAEEEQLHRMLQQQKRTSR